ncbi:unnamed protein product [Allacma fusca]|uniref:G-protein coupled receptors family 1 profile domain-containing protein n=1 Tax=Allacma fusca TaxID=39272 RepID=A0A8J2JT45_9HEXA|nr:unnamed protein product [Allacma fusca]
MDPGSITSSYFQKTVYPYLLTLILIICGISIIHNFSIAVSFIWARPSMTKTAYISFFLAAADGFSSFNLGFRLVVSSLFPFVFEIKAVENHCINLLIESTRLGGIPIPMGHSLLIGIVHWFGIVKPLERDRIVTKGRVKAFLICCWIFPMSFVLMWFSAISGQGFRSDGCTNNTFMEGLPWRTAYSALYLCPFMTIVFIYARIFMIANKSKQQNPNAGHENEFNFKAATTSGKIIGSFGLGLVPIPLVLILSYAGGPLDEKRVRFSTVIC